MAKAVTSFPLIKVRFSVPLFMGALFCAGMAQAQTQEAVQAIAACDREAGSQYDTDRPPANGFVAYDKINAAMAIDVCLRALEKAPDDRHILFNLGRSYNVAKI